MDCSLDWYYPFGSLVLYTRHCQAGVVALEGPLLPGQPLHALLHDQLVPGDGEALPGGGVLHPVELVAVPGGGVLHPVELVAVLPPLVPPGAVAGVQDHLVGYGWAIGYMWLR